MLEPESKSIICRFNQRSFRRGLHSNKERKKKKSAPNKEPAPVVHFVRDRHITTTRSQGGDGMIIPRLSNTHGTVWWDCEEKVTDYRDSLKIVVITGREQQ